MEVHTVTYEPVEIVLPSQGIIESSRRTQLASEVAGKVIAVSPKFESGESFDEDEILLELDSSDYEAALAQAKSTLADMKAALAMEKARSDQAARDWKKLGRGGEPDDLVLRIPQMESAEAKVESADAMVAKAENDLKRSKIRAPFPATIASTMVEKGGYVTPGTPVAEIFQTNPFEVRLPLSIDDSQFLKSTPGGDPAGEVVISAEAAGVVREWKGKIVRTEREIDRMTRSLYVVAEIDSESSGEGVSLQPGLFVQARITGRTIPEAAKIPFPAFLDLKRVVVVDENDQIRFRDVTILRREDDAVLVSKGLKEGERVSLTELANMIEGVEVEPRKATPDDSPPAENPETELTVKP